MIGEPDATDPSPSGNIRRSDKYGSASQTPELRILPVATRPTAWNGHARQCYFRVVRSNSLPPPESNRAIRPNSHQFYPDYPADSTAQLGKANYIRRVSMTFRFHPWPNVYSTAMGPIAEERMHAATNGRTTMLASDPAGMQRPDRPTYAASDAAWTDRAIYAVAPTPGWPRRRTKVAQMA